MNDLVKQMRAKELIAEMEEVAEASSEALSQWCLANIGQLDSRGRWKASAEAAERERDALKRQFEAAAEIYQMVERQRDEALRERDALREALQFELIGPSTDGYFFLNFRDGAEVVSAIIDVRKDKKLSKGLTKFRGYHRLLRAPQADTLRRGADVSVTPRIRCDNCGFTTDKEPIGPGREREFRKPPKWGSAKLDTGFACNYPEHIAMTDLCPKCADAAYKAVGDALKACRDA